MTEVNCHITRCGENQDGVCQADSITLSCQIPDGVSGNCCCLEEHV